MFDRWLQTHCWYPSPALLCTYMFEKKFFFSSIHKTCCHSVQFLYKIWHWSKTVAEFFFPISLGLDFLSISCRPLFRPATPSFLHLSNILKCFMDTSHSMQLAALWESPILYKNTILCFCNRLLVIKCVKIQLN